MSRIRELDEQADKLTRITLTTLHEIEMLDLFMVFIYESEKDELKARLKENFESALSE